MKGGGFLTKNGSNYQPKQFEESGWDDNPADIQILDMARSLCGVQIIWGGNYFALPPSQRWLVWDKRNDGTDFADCELAWTNQDKAVRMFRYRWNGMLQEHGGRFKEERLHPAMKPLALLNWCMGMAPEAQSVLDPFVGSGTTLVAAKKWNRKAIGIEMSENYCEIAASRLTQDILNFELDNNSETGI